MQDWFKKWFSSDEYLTVYSHRNEKDAENIIDLVLGVTDLKPGASILDAACGAGRHSIILANLGFKVTAFDLSKNLLKIGWHNAKELHANVDFVCSDIRTASFNTEFDLVLNMFTSFGYFDTDRENFAFYKNARNFIANNGIVVLDYLNENFVRNNIIPRSSKEIDDKFITETRRLENDKIIKKIQIESDSSEYEYYESVKLYEKNSIIDIFNSLGYRLENTFGDYYGNEFNKDESERLILFFRL